MPNTRHLIFATLFILVLLISLFNVNVADIGAHNSTFVENSTAVQLKAHVKTILQRSAEQGDNPVLNRPRDLAFDPSRDVLLVVNQGGAYRVTDDGTYQPPIGSECKWRYGKRKTPPQNSKYWPSFTQILNPGTSHQAANNSVDPWGIHFMAEASSIAFGTHHFSPHFHGPSEVTDKEQGYLSFATCGESRNEMKGCVDWEKGDWQPSTPLDFMGPTLWSTDPSVFGVKNTVADNYLAKSFCNGSPDREACEQSYLKPVCTADNDACETGEPGEPFTLGAHLDMLHESPMCMGIAWEKKNSYWVFDGCGGAQAQIDSGVFAVDGHGENFRLLSADQLNGKTASRNIPECKESGDIVRYDFRTDHGAGFDDHCDGIIERYAIGQVKRVEGVPSHMILWQDHLFIADSGNKRIARLNPAKAGSRGDYSQKPLSERVNKACTVVWDMENAQDKILVTHYDFSDTSHFGMPSGLAIYPNSAFGLERPDIENDILLITDNSNSKLLFVSLTDSEGTPGTLLAWIDLSDYAESGALMGLAVHPKDNTIYMVDAVKHKILQVSPIFQ